MKKNYDTNDFVVRSITLHRFLNARMPLFLLLLSLLFGLWALIHKSEMILISSVVSAIIFTLMALVELIKIF